jgi:hypothetical protein
VGLSGELRPVPNGQQQLGEATRGVPQGDHPAAANKPGQAISCLDVTAVHHLSLVVDKISEEF